MNTISLRNDKIGSGVLLLSGWYWTEEQSIMKFAGFLFFSTLEYMSSVYFILILFRFKVMENLLKFVVFSIVLSFVSNSLLTESLQVVSSLIQPALMIFFVAFFLRVHVFNSMIMVITSYVTGFIIQSTIVAMALHIGAMEEVVPYTANAFIIQASSSFVMFMFALVTYLQKGGFSFIDNESRLKRTKFFSLENRSFIIFLTLSIMAVFAAGLLLNISKNPPYLLVSLILFIALMGLLYICLKRDGAENGRSDRSFNR
ncbi:hypothetical protein [Cohnella luojiensis]|uniref:Uncharacterized protein n=1 Tax=Cohnella luojiensis TaxID=652876 RepID=A0A4Y8LQD8_9BACL|nr:hypothetical protein [Cohnella luojiensis]TFE23524.1 hypothetical protein E2980_18700 [Cohnella luojiensis]